MGFLAWLLPLLAKLGLDFWIHKGPAPIVVEAEKAGAESQSATDIKQALATETAVAQAEAQAPKTQTQVVKSLDSGTF